MNNKSLKDKKIISEKLRNENKKMELRLQELKLTMNKEKEERLLNGNSSMWSSGAPGTILNYKPTLSAIDRTKKVKLKILKEEDEEIVLHEVKGQLQRKNIKGIFKADSLSSRGDNADRPDLYSREDNYGKKMKCGQCEESPAAVNCKECTEIYCAKCFAAFHLKGALRKHRSTPISNLSNRISIPSPLFTAPEFNNSYHNNILSKENNIQQKGKHNILTDPCKEINPRLKHSKENRSPRYDGLSLVDGAYDEGLSTQYFQDALLAWRNSEDPPYKPIKHPTISQCEHSTETTSLDNNKKLLEDSIHFTPSLSYAEKLLLRKHRSCQLPPVEMKYVLNRLSKNNEAELMENQRLLQSNLELETAAINSSINCGLLSDNVSINIESLTNLWAEAALLTEKEPLKVIDALTNTKFEIKELISFSDNYNNEFPELSYSKRATKTMDINQYQNIDQKEEVVLNSEDNQNNSSNEINIIEFSKLKENSKRPHSAIQRSDFNERPHSARKMSARNTKGGMITTKPSLLLDVLARFNEYLPSISTESCGDSPMTRSSSAGAGLSKSKSKLNYNFYKTAPQSWKPAVAWCQKESMDNPHKYSESVIYPEIQDKEYEEELQKLNFFSNNSVLREMFSDDFNDKLSSSNSDMSAKSDLHNNVDVCGYDKDDEEENALEQLQSFERELTLISCKEVELNNGVDYDEILADSLDLQNLKDSLDLLQSDKFNFEDSLDFQQRSFNNSDVVEDDSDEDIVNCSSRFNDYEDVNNLK